MLKENLHCLFFKTNKKNLCKHDNSFGEDSTLCAERIATVNMPRKGNEFCTHTPWGQDTHLSKAKKGATQDYGFYTSQLCFASLSRKPQDTRNTLAFDETEPWMKETNGEETCRGPARRQDFLSNLFHSGLAVTKGQRQSCWLTELRVQAGRKTKLVFQTFLPSADARHAVGEQREDVESNEAQ